MTPVVLMTDTYLANGSSLWRIPELKDLPAIKPQGVPEELKGKYNPALRDENGVRYMAIPGMEGFQYRNMGLERDAEKGSISTNPENHQKMILARQAKVDQVADRIPEAEVWGNAESDTLLVGFGSTEGHLKAAAQELDCALLQLNYIYPLQRNVGDIIRSYKKVIVCELNSGQLAAYLRSQVPNVTLLQYNQMTAQPFQVEQIVEFVNDL
jgi:2-oxoglutarate ferredoxin oxidoreductase subunit alpha